MIIEHNVTTGEVIEREMNAEELSQQKVDQAKAEVETQAAATKAAEKAALLAKLGITDNEAKLLLS